MTSTPQDPPQPPAPAPAEGQDGPRFDCAAELRQRFPALFAGAPKPLKLRIQADIQERAPGVFSKQALSAFFRRYTGSTGYLTAAVLGGLGNDDLTLTVNDDSGGGGPSTLEYALAVLDGGPGTDTCVATPDVQVFNCEA